MKKRKALDPLEPGIDFIDLVDEDVATTGATSSAKRARRRAHQLDHHPKVSIPRAERSRQNVIQLEEDQKPEEPKRRKSSGRPADDPFDLTPPPADAKQCYYHWCVQRLSLDFPRATMGSVRRVLKCHHKRLGPSYEAMHVAYELALCREQGKRVVFDSSWLPPEGFKLNKLSRTSAFSPREKCPVFERELAAVRARYSQQKPAPPVCQDIECGCCFSETKFEELAQCADGHLFCFNCLKRHVEEAAFGGGQAHSALPCMDTAGCTDFFLWSEVSRALPAEVLVKYEKRLAEDSVARARIDGLVYCPFCNFPCELHPEYQSSVLECPNASCKKSSCLKCKEPSHLPLGCHEAENRSNNEQPSETSTRRRIEELMTKAYIRECVACKAELVKVDGCNKIKCRCRQAMCYVCRRAIPNDYSHFCQHPREPGEKCLRCDKCGLWDQEESEAVVQAVKAAAVKEAAEQEPGIVSKRIGPDEEKNKKLLPSVVHPF